MAQPSKQSPLAGGIFVPLGVFIGIAIGIAAGQLMIGFLAGVAAGIIAIIALDLWQRSRR